MTFIITKKIDDKENEKEEIKKELERVVERQGSIDAMIPEIIFKSGDYFGELALLNRRGRAGTVVTLTDSFFSVISYDSYERLLKKD